FLLRVQIFRLPQAFLPVSATPTSREPEIPMPDKFDGDCYKFCVELIISPVTGESSSPLLGQFKEGRGGWSEQEVGPQRRGRMGAGPCGRGGTGDGARMFGFL
uniref:Uncharacterized protein n=1 Tax=Terrapene triunguis TaxID=2587831 RepID=A0A674I025_9SAUR